MSRVGTLALQTAAKLQKTFLSANRKVQVMAWQSICENVLFFHTRLKEEIAYTELGVCFRYHTENVLFFASLLEHFHYASLAAYDVNRVG